MNIGQRLKEERERIGYSQEKLGAIGGVQKRAQINYETGERQPDAAYLRGVAQIGVDVQYVLVGVRSANLMEIFLSDDFVNETNLEHARSHLAGQRRVMTPDVQKLIAVYERCKPEGQKLLITTAELLAADLPVAQAQPIAPKPKRAAKADSIEQMPSIQVGNMTNHAAGGVQVGYAGGKVTSTVIKKVKKPKE